MLAHGHIAGFVHLVSAINLSADILPELLQPLCHVVHAPMRYDQSRL